MGLHGATHLTGSRQSGLRGTLESRCAPAARAHSQRDEDLGHTLDCAELIGFCCVYVVFTGDLSTPAGWLGSPGFVWLIGATVFVSGSILVTWSMIANPFFEKTVRIQREHGHRVIDSGTYAYVRHPGYVGFSAMCLSTPVLLGSVPTALPIAVLELLLVTRTLLEDRMLQAELPGYAEYATKVRSRLIPRVW